MLITTNRRTSLAYLCVVLMACGVSAVAHAQVVVTSGTASYGVDMGCSPVYQGPPPPLTANVFYEEVDLTTRPSGRTDNWHGWGAVSWSVSSGNTIRILASGGGTEGYNGALCTLPTGGQGWLYGRGHGNVNLTLTLDRALTHTSIVSGSVSGISNGSGTLQIGQHTISGQSSGPSGFSLDVSLSPAPEDATLSISLEHPQVWANGHEESLVTVRVEVGGIGAAGRTIALVAESATTVVDPPTNNTNDKGEAQFTVRSNTVGSELLTAKLLTQDPSDPALVASATIKFVKKRAVVLVQGIKTRLSSANDHETFPLLRSFLTNAGFVRATRGAAEVSVDCSDQSDSDGDNIPNDGCPLILNLSYTGGRIEEGGLWVPDPYECGDTAQELNISLSRMRLLLLHFASENPNTTFVILGHSQGGFLALQSLWFAQTFAIDTVVTLDGALGGTPRLETAVTDRYSCWGDPAAKGLIDLWNSTSKRDRIRQGTAAVFAFGPRPRPSNGALVTAARSSLGKTRVMTVGSWDDCVFNPKRCALLGVDNTSSQIVETADFYMRFHLGQNCSYWELGDECIEFSHAVVHENATVVNQVIAFIGAPTAP